MAMWFAASEDDVPSLTHSARAPADRPEDTQVTEENHERIDEIDAVGAVFFAHEARIVAKRTLTGEVVSLGSCRGTFRLDATKAGYDPIRAKRTARFEIAAGLYTNHPAALEPGAGRGTGYARLTVRAKMGNKKGLAKLCDLRVFDLSVLRNKTWLQTTRLGVVSRVQAPDGHRRADNHDLLSLTLRRNAADGMTGRLSEEERKRTRDRLSQENHEEKLIEVELQTMIKNVKNDEVNAIVHSIEDLDTHYEHGKVNVRDHLAQTLASLVEAKRRSTERIAALEARSRDSADRALSDRLKKLEKTLHKALESELRRTNFNLQHTATKEVRDRVKQDGKMWRLPFWALLLGLLAFAYKARSKYLAYKKMHML